MAVTSTNMSLRIWNLLNDPFDHAQLATNWDKVDQHDHTSGRGVQIPTGGLADLSISTAKIADLGVTTPKIADGSITSAKLGTDVSNDIGYGFSAYRSLLRRSAQFVAPASGAQYALGTNAASTTWATPGMLFYLDPADLSATSIGKTTKYRLRADFLVGSTAMTNSPSTALLQVTDWGTGAAPSVTGTGLVTGSITAPSSPPGANSQTVWLSQTEFTIPSAGWYFISHSIAAQSATWNISVELQYRVI